MAETAPSAWAPFKRKAFLVLWIATVISNIGTWMHDVGAGWLMTELSPSPLIVAAVQAATTLPVFMFALLAGAIADIYDRRKLLIYINCFMLVTASILALLVYLNAMTPLLLLIFTFLLGAGAAFMAPAWQAIVPKLVSKEELQSAISFNSMGINVSRAIGPALAGFLIVAVGLYAPFVLNAFSFLAIIAALLWWKPPADKVSRLPPEGIFGAIFSGLKYGLNSKPLLATLARAVAFFVFASAYWAMLPLIAREVLQGDATLYGILLTSVGAGAVSGALLLPRIKKLLNADKTVMFGTFGTALVLLVFAYLPHNILAVIAAAIGGFCWIAVLSSFHVSAQTSLPDWVRARGLSLFLTVFFGAMASGSLIWGKVASDYSIVMCLTIAATGLFVMVPVTWRFKLNQGIKMDHTPSSHWQDPILDDPQAHSEDRGPIMIQIHYEISAENHDEFRTRIHKLSEERKRHGGYFWSLMQVSDQPDHFVETWFESSWLNHLRHHDRVSNAEKELQAACHELHVGSDKPMVKHYIT